MKEIKLSQQGKNKGKYVALVDDEDYERVGQFRWCAFTVINSDICYAKKWLNKTGVTLLHRFILGITDKKIHVDHIDHNGLNCQKSNLRTCTNTENQGNRRISKNINSTSIYKGVWWNTYSRKYVSIIRKNHKTYFLGSFVNDIDAAKEYDKKAIELYGEFANTNFKTE
jgi:hypothetical protein